MAAATAVWMSLIRDSGLGERERESVHSMEHTENHATIQNSGTVNTEGIEKQQLP